MTRIVIQGADTAGTIMKTRLRRLCVADVRDYRTSITVIDQSADHFYQPGLPILPFRVSERDQHVRPLRSGCTGRADHPYLRGKP